MISVGSTSYIRFCVLTELFFIRVAIPVEEEMKETLFGDSSVRPIIQTPFLSCRRLLFFETFSMCTIVIGRRFPFRCASLFHSFLFLFFPCVFISVPEYLGSCILLVS